MNGRNGGKHNDGRMSGRGDTRGGRRQHQGRDRGDNNGISIMINSTASCHHQAHNKRMKMSSGSDTKTSEDYNNANIIYSYSLSLS